MRLLALFVALTLTLTACAAEDSASSTNADTSNTDTTEPGPETAAPEPDTTEAEPDTTGPQVDGVEPEADTTEPVSDVIVPPGHAFRFGTSPDQTMSAAPFPNDLYLGADGTVAVAPLVDDPVLGDMANPPVLDMLNTRMVGRTGFGFANAVHFFATQDIDIDSAQSHTTIITLSGPEAGRIVEARAEWAPYTQSIAVSAAWGDYLMPASTYAVLLTDGIKTAEGEAITQHDEMPAVLAAEGADDAIRSAFAPLRSWLAGEDATVASSDIIMATVFTTEATLPHGREVLEVIDTYTLAPPTRTVGYNSDSAEYIVADVIEGDGLTTYFGVPSGPFEYNPGSWTGSNREEAAQFLEDGAERYDGGSLHKGIGRVINGSFKAPALGFMVQEGKIKNVPLQRDDAGTLTWSLEAMVPFTLYLCDEHLTDASNIPVAVFTHGGNGHRSSGQAWANLNCTLGVATFSYDNIYHGGRIILALNEDETTLLPVQVDELNVYTGLTIEDEGFVGDYAGDNKGGPETVGQLYALPLQLDPGISEGNLLTMMSDTHALVRHIKEGDWSQVQGGLSFDSTKVFHQGLSYGTSFTTPLLAMTQDFVGEVWSVGSGAMVTGNLCTAPDNAELASGFMRLTLGLKPTAWELIDAVWLDPIVGLIQWLSQRGDPLGYAPYVLRHREDDYELPILATGDSWDETLSAAAQMSFGRAVGLPVYTQGDAWTLDATQPAGDSVEATAYEGTPLTGNATFGDRTHSAAIFYAQRSCHAMQIRPVCTENYQKPYPPIAALEDDIVTDSPVCAIQTQTAAFMSSLLAGSAHPDIVAPEGTCEALYGP